MTLLQADLIQVQSRALLSSPQPGEGRGLRGYLFANSAPDYSALDQGFGTHCNIQGYVGPSPLSPVAADPERLGRNLALLNCFAAPITLVVLASKFNDFHSVACLFPGGSVCDQGKLA